MVTKVNNEKHINNRAEFLAMRIDDSSEMKDGESTGW
jgi:hypothetical protein